MEIGPNQNTYFVHTAPTPSPRAPLSPTQQPSGSASMPAPKQDSDIVFSRHKSAPSIRSSTSEVKQADALVETLAEKIQNAKKPVATPRRSPAPLSCIARLMSCSSQLLCCGKGRNTAPEPTVGYEEI